MDGKHTRGPLTAQASGVYSKTGIKLADTLPRERMLATGGDPAKQYGAIGASMADAKLYAAAPDLLAVAERLHMDINGLHATMRATNTEYRTSELCRQMDALIRDNAAAIARAEGGEA